MSRRSRSGRRRTLGKLDSVIDWNLAGTVARGVANLQPAGDPAPFEQLAGPAEEAERLVSAYTRLVPVQPVPVAEAVDRAGWIEANLAGLAAVLEPTAQRIAGNAGPLGSLAGGVVAIEAGAVSGFLAGRVLGQYEFGVLDPDKPARLLFVAPNLAHGVSLHGCAPKLLEELVRKGDADGLDGTCLERISRPLFLMPLGVKPPPGVPR